MYESGDAVYICKTGNDISYNLFEKTAESFVVNLTTEKLKKGNRLVRCNVSGRDVDKWKEMHLTAGKASKLDHAPIIEECPVNIECKVQR